MVGGIRVSHGQLADSPTDIPPLGWRDIGLRLFKGVMEDRVLLIAAGATYYMLIALVPGLALFVSLYGLFNDPVDVYKQVSLLSGLLPQGGLDLLTDQLTRLAVTGKPTLGLTLVVSLTVALWSANAGVQSFFDAMNVAYGEAEKRNFLLRTGLGFVFTLGFAIAAIVFLAVVVVIPVVLQFFYLSTGFEWLVKLLGYALMLAILALGISVLYRWGPSRSLAKWRWITPGVGLAVLGIALVSVIFSWYAANFSNYNATYGSLGALIGFLTWLWLSSVVVIVGAELDAELEHQTVRDSTTGAPLPMGTRGAYMADHVAVVGGGADADPDATERRPGMDLPVALGLLAIITLAGGSRRPRARRPRP